MRFFWAFFLLGLSVSAQAKVDQAILDQVDQSPPCEGLDLFSDKVLHAFTVPESCIETKAFRARVLTYDDRVRSDCRSISAEYSARIRGAATCESISLDSAGYRFMSKHLEELKTPGEHLEYETLFGTEAKDPACREAHQNLEDSARKELGLIGNHYGILNYVVADPCGDPGASEYTEYLRRGEPQEIPFR